MRFVLGLGVVLVLAGCRGRIPPDPAGEGEGEGEGDVGEGEGDTGEGEGEGEGEGGTSWAVFVRGDPNGSLIAADSTSLVLLASIRNPSTLVDQTGALLADIPSRGFVVDKFTDDGALLWHREATSDRWLNEAALAIDAQDRVWVAVRVQPGTGGALTLGDVVITPPDTESLVVARFSADGDVEMVEPRVGGAIAFGLWDDGSWAELATIVGGPTLLDGELTWRDPSGAVLSRLALPGMHAFKPQALQVFPVDPARAVDDVVVNVFGYAPPELLPWADGQGPIADPSVSSLVGRIGRGGVAWAKVFTNNSNGGFAWLNRVDGGLLLGGDTRNDPLVDAVTGAELVPATVPFHGFIGALDLDGTLQDVVRVDGAPSSTPSAASFRGDLWLTVEDRTDSSAVYARVRDDGPEEAIALRIPEPFLSSDELVARGDVLATEIVGTRGIDLSPLVPGSTFVPDTTFLALVRLR